MDQKNKKFALVAIACFAILAGVSGVVGLVVFLASTMFIGKDFDAPILENPLANSEIQFILGSEPVNQILLNPDQAQLYRRVKDPTPPRQSGHDDNQPVVETYHMETSPIKGVQLQVNGSTAIYAPIDGTVTEDVASNVFIQSVDRMWQAYIHTVSLTVAPGSTVHKGDLIGFSSGVIDAGMSELIGGLNTRHYEYRDYYNQYLYWTTTNNYFPLLSPPKDGKLTYRYSSGFGVRTHPVTGEPDTFHEGLDIAVVMNTPVLAVESGTIGDVNSAKDGNAAGNRLYLISDDGLRKYAFMHLNVFLVHPGDQVRKGQRIALSGNTGRTTGPHLHIGFFDVRHNTYIDPEPAVKRWEGNMDWDYLKMHQNEAGVPAESPTPPPVQDPTIQGGD